MKGVKNISPKEAIEILESFHEDKQSIVMATADKNGVPFVSYAPFVEDEELNIYVMLSRHVKHAQNLVDTKIASIMSIEDESKCENIFARGRFYGQVEANKIDKVDGVVELFVKRFGDIAGMIAKMSDFEIYKLSFVDANLVLGFGAAFNVSLDRKSAKLKSIKHDDK